MTAIAWDDLSLVATFGFGLLTGIIVTIRLAKIIAEFLRREREK